MATILIDTPNSFMREALESHLTAAGFRTSTDTEHEIDLVLRDLQADVSPYPTPPPYPTLAFVSGGDKEVIHLLYLGYKGYLRPEDREKVVPAIQAVLRGEIWGERHLISRALEKHTAPQLTPREHQVHYLIVRRLSNRDIGKQLGITEKTVKGYVTNLLSKLGAEDRTELILNAQKLPGQLPRQPSQERSQDHRLNLSTD